MRRSDAGDGVRRHLVDSPGSPSSTRSPKQERAEEIIGQIDLMGSNLFDFEEGEKASSKAMYDSGHAVPSLVYRIAPIHEHLISGEPSALAFAEKRQNGRGHQSDIHSYESKIFKD